MPQGLSGLPFMGDDTVGSVLWGSADVHFRLYVRFFGCTLFSKIELPGL